MKKKSIFAPYDCYESIYQIDYDKLLKDNKRVIIFDLDNTILPYHIKKTTPKTREFMQSLLDKGFEVLLMSNNHKKRISKVGKALGIKYIYSAKKPLKYGYLKALKKFHDYDKNEFVCVGDQIITDVFGANRVGIDCILVKPILLENEHWYTKLNRITERRIIRKFQKKDPSVYRKIYEIRGDIKS